MSSMVAQVGRTGADPIRCFSGIACFVDNVPAAVGFDLESAQ